jgi:hypothetical protein
MKKKNPLKDFTYIRIYKNLKNYQSFSFERHSDYIVYKAEKTYKTGNHKDNYHSFRICRTTKEKK